MKLTSSLLIALLFSLPSFSQPDNAAISGKADEYLIQLSSLNRFRGNVLIARAGTIIYQKGFGLANIEDSVPNSIKTRFPIASLTKAFTATGILMLVEKKLLTVQDKITKYVANAPKAWNEITIHHLLSHSSGIPDYSQDSGWLSMRSCGIDFHQTLSLFQNKSLLFKPGAQYSYSNSGYVLLGYIIEKITGLSYDRYITENILKPLNLHNTFIDDNRTIIHYKAKGYIRDGLELTSLLPLNMEIGKPAGGIVSTAEDLLKWEQSFYSNKLLSAKSRELMFTVYAGDYGYGWHIDSLNGEKRVNHLGVMLGYKTNIDRYPGQEVTVVLLCNADDVFINAAIKDLGAIALGKPYKLPQKRKMLTLPAEKLRKYAGTYQSDDGLQFVIQVAGDHLNVLYKDKTYNLYAETETAFFSDEYDAQLMFSFSGTPNIQSLLYNKKVKARKL
jgi:CubicO group peptidase (beta-lactamase class C family)